MLTTKSMTRQLIEFSIPLVLSGLLQQLFSWADAFIVGNILGEGALAAVGATMYISALYLAAVTGFTSGVSILSAQMFGQGRHEEQKKVLFTFLMVLSGAFLVATGAGLYLVEPILRMMDTPADIFDMAREYLWIVMWGVPFLTIYNVYAAVLRGIGDSRSPTAAVMVSVSVNVVLDVLLVGVIPMGVAGAALATVLSQVMMALFLVVYAGRRHALLHLDFGNERVDLGLFREGCRLAVPITVQSLVCSVGGLTLGAFMNGFGSQTVAAISTAYRVDSVILLPVFNLGTGISTLAAQSTGAGEHQRARKFLYVGSALMAVVCIFLTGFVLVAGGPLVGLFGVTQEATQIGGEFFRCIAVFYVIHGWTNSLRGYLEGVGDVVFTGATGILSLLVRIALSYALMDTFGNMVIAYAEGLAWCFTFVLFLVRVATRKSVPLARDNSL